MPKRTTATLERSKRPALCLGCLVAHPEGQHRADITDGRQRIDRLLELADALKLELWQVEAELAREVARHARTANGGDTLLDVAECAYFLGVGTDWVRDHGEKHGLRVELPDTTKHLYSYQKIQGFIRQRRR